LKELYTLLAPTLFSIKNDIARFNRGFFWKMFGFLLLSTGFVFVITKLLNAGMAKLQSLSPDVFTVLLLKVYSLIFMLLFFMQVISVLVISLHTFYQSKDLEVLFTSPVSRTSLFFSRLIGTHIKASWMLVLFGMPLLVSAGIFHHASLVYYPFALLLFISFSIIPVNIGIGITIILAAFLHVRKLRKFLISTGVITIVLLVTLLRIFKPERFVNPELFANLTLFVSEMKTPTFVLLPNRWLSESIFSILSNNMTSTALIHIALLFLTSYIVTLFLQILFKRYHYRGWGLVQEGAIIREGPRRASKTVGAMSEPKIPVLENLLRLFDIRSGAIIKKDLMYHMREPRNIHQILILFSLLVVYFFSIASLPLNWEDYALQLRYIVSFFNLGLILFIIASLCARLVYPSIVGEGLSLWIMKTSPVTPKRFVWTKFLFFSIPLFGIGMLLTLFSSTFIGVEKAFVATECTTVSLLVFSLVGLALSYGISDMKDMNTSSQEQTKTGSTAFMFVSVFLILFTLALEIIPVFLYFLREAKKGAFTQTAWIAIGAMIFVVFLINLIVTALSIRLSMKKIENLDLS